MMKKLDEEDDDEDEQGTATPRILVFGKR